MVSSIAIQVFPLHHTPLTNLDALALNGDLSTILTNLQENNFFLVDEIQDLNPRVSKGFNHIFKQKMGITIGKGSSARNITLDIPHFTLICTTSRINRVASNVVGSVFSVFFLKDYSNDELVKICQSIIEKHGYTVEFNVRAIQEIVSESNGNPGNAGRLIEKLIKFSEISHRKLITQEAVIECLHLSGHTSKSFIKKSDRHISNNVKREVWQRDEGKCSNCGSNEYLEFDHIIAVAIGGSNTVRNIQLLCEPCNRKKATKLDG